MACPRIAYALVFGSSARGTSHSSTDIDVAFALSAGRRPTSLELGDLAGRLPVRGSPSICRRRHRGSHTGFSAMAWSCSNVTGRLSWPVVLFCFCAPRVHGGRKGLLFSVFPLQPFPTGLILSATLWQENARSYGPPVFFCPDETPNC